MASLSDVELTDRIRQLNEIVVPPDGTPRAAVERVFGTPRIEETLTGKGIPAHYPMHSYQLLPTGRHEFRALLYMTCRDGVVTSAAINHMCVKKNRKGGPATPELARSLRLESELVLVDLDEIVAKYRSELENAP